MRFRILLPLFLLAATAGAWLHSPSLQAGIWEKHCGESIHVRKWQKHRRDSCGPVNWKWMLPVGNGHYIAPDPCIGPPAYYTPQLPLYYRGPILRTIDMPLDEPLP